MLIKDNNYKVLRLFFDAPEKKFHLRQIARLTKLSPPGVSKIVARLKKTGLLLSESTGVVENIFAAKTEDFLRMKRCHNILSLYDSGLIDFLKDEYEEPEAIVLFGSFATGSDTSKSDIDIAVITSKNKSLDFRRFEAKLGRKLNIYEVKIQDCKKEFLNTLANGIVLHGYLKVVS